MLMSPHCSAAFHVLPRLCLILAFCGVIPGANPTLHAQPVAGGVITGRVLDPVTGEYLRNADVSIAGGPSVATTSGGEYRLGGVPPGEVTVVVGFTGYQTGRSVVEVRSGETVTRDFELRSSQVPGTADQPLQLSAFVVAGHREGNAKAIMDQRQSMNITNSVSSDAFGDIAEGNIGEFIKNMPGVDADSLDGTVRYVRLRGLPSEYASVTINGVGLSSTNAGAAVGNARAFSFEQVSLSSVESIEISKTISADVDANAPAGNINLKTKRAFDRKGRRVSVQGSVSAQSDHFTWDRTYAPGDDRKRKILPSARLEFSDVFLNNRLGVVFSISDSNAYIQREVITVGWNYVPTAASPAPVTMTNLRSQQIEQTVRRFSSMLTIDYKALPGLVLSLDGIYNYADIWSGQRSWLFTTGDRASAVIGDPLRDFTTTHPAARVNTESLGIAKRGDGLTLIPSFEYRKADLTIDGRLAFSDSNSKYDPLDFRGALYSVGEIQLSPATFHAQRGRLADGDWRFTQLAGQDWSDGARYTTPVILAEDGRYAKSEIVSGDVNATLRTRTRLPVVWKTGVKGKRETMDFRNDRAAHMYTYAGPGAGIGAWAHFPSPVRLDFSDNAFHATSINGQNTLFMPSILELGRLFRERPEYFTRSFTADNYYTSQIANTRHYEEEINAAFFMATVPLERLSARAGLRWEETETRAREADPLTPAEVRAAGFAVGANGRATTIPGLQHQYESRPRVERKGSYDHLFPSASLKYEIVRGLDLQLGYSRTIRRPPIDQLAGVWSVNDTTRTVSAPNPQLEPEISDNLSLRLARYFEPIGIVALNLYENKVKGLFQGVELTAEEFGYSGDEYPGYLFTTTRSAPGERITVRGMEVEYNQTLSFLPRPFRGLSVRAAYTRNTADTIVEGMAPHLVAGGLAFSLRRLNLNASLNWAADTPLDSAGVFLRHRFQMDAGGNFRLYRQWQLFCSVRNIFDTPYIRMELKGTGNPALSRLYQKFGVTTTLGLRATF